MFPHTANTSTITELNYAISWRSATPTSSLRTATDSENTIENVHAYPLRLEHRVVGSLRQRARGTAQDGPAAHKRHARRAQYRHRRWRNDPERKGRRSDLPA